MRNTTIHMYMTIIVFSFCFKQLCVICSRAEKYYNGYIP